MGFAFGGPSVFDLAFGGPSVFGSAFGGPSVFGLAFGGPSVLGLALGGSSDWGLAFGADGGSGSFGSSSISDHCVRFFGTVSLGTAVALDGDCVPGGVAPWAQK